MLALVCSILLFNAAFGQTNNCDKMCTDQYQPVCGTDYRTYSNICYLDIAECKARLTHHFLTLAHSGACSVSHSGGQPNPGGILNVHCDLICDDEVNDGEVCATDGKTYDNHCEYDNARCLALRKGVHLSVRHSGACTNQDVFCPIYCDPNDISPVCSARNTTYRNACYLEQLRCKYAKIPTLAASFELAHNGSCDGIDPNVTHKLDCSQYESNAMIAVEGGHHTSSLNNCPRIYKPVCGVDLRTHTNACYYCHTMTLHHNVAADHTVPVIVDKACPSYLNSHSYISSVIG